MERTGGATGASARHRLTGDGLPSAHVQLLGGRRQERGATWQLQRQLVGTWITLLQEGPYVNDCLCLLHLMDRCGSTFCALVVAQLLPQRDWHVSLLLFNHTHREEESKRP